MDSLHTVQLNLMPTNPRQTIHKIFYRTRPTVREKPQHHEILEL